MSPKAWSGYDPYEAEIVYRAGVDAERKVRREHHRDVIERLERRYYDEEEHERGLKRIRRANQTREVATRTWVEPLGFEPYVPRLDRVEWPNVGMFLRMVAIPGTDTPAFGLWGILDDVR